MLTQELRELIHLYWDQVYRELGQGPASHPEWPMDMEAMMGHSLARVMARGRELLQEAPGLTSDQRQQWGAGLDWLERNMNEETLPSDYQKILSHYRLGVTHAETAAWFWRSLPVEVQGALLDLSDFRNTEEFQNSPLLLARALAQTFCRSRGEEWNHLDEPGPDSHIEPVSLWIQKKFETLIAEDKAPLIFSGKGDSGQDFLRGLVFQYYQALAGESRREIMEVFHQLDPPLQRILNREQEKLRRSFRKQFPGWNGASRELLALGLAVGFTLDRLYAGFLYFGTQTRLFSPESLGIPSEDLKFWIAMNFQARELETLTETLGNNPEGVSTYRHLIESIQKLYLKWRPFHPLIQGMEEGFSLDSQRQSFWDRLERLEWAVWQIEHGPAIQLQRGIHPEIWEWIAANARVMPAVSGGNPTQALARALAMTLGQSNGIQHPWLGHAFSFRGLVPAGEDSQYLLQKPISAMPPGPALRFQNWFRNLLGEIQNEPSLLELWSYLNADLGTISGQAIWESLGQLPPLWVGALWDRLPWLQFWRGEGWEAARRLGHMGTGIGEFFRESYVEILRLGAKRGWLDPRELNVWLTPPGLSGSRRFDDFLNHGVDRPFVLDTLSAHEWFSENIQRWGGKGHPLYLGFRKGFFQGDLEEADPERLRMAAQEVAENLAEEG